MLKSIVFDHSNLIDDQNDQITNLIDWATHLGNDLDQNTDISTREQAKVLKLMQANLAKARKLKTTTVLNKFAKEGTTKRAKASAIPSIATRISEFGSRPKTRKRQLKLKTIKRKRKRYRKKTYRKKSKSRN